MRRRAVTRGAVLCQRAAVMPAADRISSGCHQRLASVTSADETGAPSRSERFRFPEKASLSPTPRNALFDGGTRRTREVSRETTTEPTRANSHTAYPTVQTRSSLAEQRGLPGSLNFATIARPP
jgi:hypothetical protein